MYLVLLILLPVLSNGCYWNDKNPYRYFGGKTPYNEVRGDIRDSPPLEGCEPTNVWFLIRHGTRLPAEESAQKMKTMIVIKKKILDSYEKGRGELCAQDITNLRNWTWDPRMGFIGAQELTDEGYFEHYEYGTRFYQKFSQLLNNLDSYLLRPTQEERTEISALAFTDGIATYGKIFNASKPLKDITNLRNWTWDPRMGFIGAQELTDEGYFEHYEYGTRFYQKFSLLLNNLDGYLLRPTQEERTEISALAFTDGIATYGKVFNASKPLKVDEVARGYLHCDKRNREVMNGPQIRKEMEKYYQTEEFKNVIKMVRKRTGLDRDLSPWNISALYNLCRFYRAYSVDRKSAWCAVFSNAELEVMEYTSDIYHYYRNSYGAPINVQLGAMPLKDLYEKFTNASKDGKKTVTGYFSHDTMIDMIFSALGLFKDYPELSGFERVKDRKWRVSFNSPFAANFMAVLNRCKETHHDGKTDEEVLKVQFFVNEHELHLCKDRACSWEDFVEKFSAYKNANLDMC